MARRVSAHRGAVDPSPGRRSAPHPSADGEALHPRLRLLLEAYYEPTFSAHSHGFRPGRGCHTALTDLAIGWAGTRWFIEGDIPDCFGSLDHEVMARKVSEKVRDNRCLPAIHAAMAAGLPSGIAGGNRRRAGNRAGR